MRKCSDSYKQASSEGRGVGDKKQQWKKGLQHLKKNKKKGGEDKWPKRPNPVFCLVPVVAITSWFSYT
jgi:hypothetical protein